MTFVGVRLREMGMLGPFNIDENRGLAIILGAAPNRAASELLAWYGREPVPGDEGEVPLVGSFAFGARTEALVVHVADRGDGLAGRSVAVSNDDIDAIVASVSPVSSE